MDLIILKQLEEINKKLANVVTKDDAKNFATKTDLKKALANYPTKIDLKNELAKYITKDYFETELKRQLNEQSEFICNDIGKTTSELFTETDKLKADRADVAELNKRVTKLERRTKIN